MNKANESIGWADYTWNPIKGICPVGCWYCYARKIYKRFLMDKYFYYEKYNEKNPGTSPLGDERELFEPFKLKEPSKIFVCSTYEIFHTEADFMRDSIFQVIEANPQHTFQILTKRPENIDRPMPDNVWLGITVTGEPREMDRDKLDIFGDIKAKVKFVSYEPILGYVPFETTDEFDWLILGRLTGYGKKYDHRVHLNMDFIKEIIKVFREDGTKIFMKDNLKEIWDERLIQEFPKE